MSVSTVGGALSADETLARLVDAISAQSLLLVVGPAVGQWAGTPKLGELLGPIRQASALPHATSISDLVEHYVGSHEQGRALLVSSVADSLNPFRSAFSFPSELIKQLPLRTIIALTVDEIIEGTFEKLPAKNYTSHDVLVSPEVPAQGTAIVRPLGGPGLGFLRITEDEIGDVAEGCRPLVDALRSGGYSSVLLVGVDLGDETTLLALKYFLVPLLQGTIKERYCLLPRHSRAQSEEFLALQINPVELGAPVGEEPEYVSKFLENLLNLVRSAAPTSSDRSSNQEAGRAIGEIPAAIQSLLVERLGTGLSLQITKPEAIDSAHRYTSIFRQDLLDYPTGDYVSVRRLTGINESDVLSSYICYSESSEQKVSFRQMGVLAYEAKTLRPLVVDPFDSDSDRLAFSHTFRIRFATPIAPGELFDVVFTLRLPGELEVLSDRKEVMSISLVRLTRQVELVEFNVCLDFKPTAVSVNCLDDQGHQTACGGKPPVVEPYVPELWYEKDFDLDWTASPYRVRWNIVQPTSKLYIIEYAR